MAKKNFPFDDRSCPNLTFKIRTATEIQRSLPAHRHDFFEILFFTSGALEPEIGDRTYQAVAGSVFFIPPTTVHRIPIPTDAEVYLISYGATFLRPHLRVDPVGMHSTQSREYPELTPFLFQKHLNFRVMEENFSYLLRLCQRMMEENRCHRIFSSEILRSYLFLFIGRVSQLYEKELLALSTEGSHHIPHRESIAKIMDYLRGNVRRKITLSDVADSVCLSPNYVSHLIRRETGRSFTDLVTEHRVETATELLCHTSLRVSEIAMRVGFEDEAYFSRRFRKLRGVSPRHYRDRRSKKDLSNLL